MNRACGPLAAFLWLLWALWRRLHSWKRQLCNNCGCPRFGRVRYRTLRQVLQLRAPTLVPGLDSELARYKPATPSAAPATPPIPQCPAAGAPHGLPRRGTCSTGRAGCPVRMPARARLRPCEYGELPAVQPVRIARSASRRGRARGGGRRASDVYHKRRAAAASPEHGRFSKHARPPRRYQPSAIADGL